MDRPGLERLRWKSERAPLRLVAAAESAKICLGRLNWQRREKLRREEENRSSSLQKRSENARKKRKESEKKAEKWPSRTGRPEFKNFCRRPDDFNPGQTK